MKFIINKIIYKITYIFYHKNVDLSMKSSHFTKKSHNAQNQSTESRPNGLEKSVGLIWVQVF